MYVRKISVKLGSYNPDEIEIDINEALASLEEKERKEPQLFSVISYKESTIVLLVAFGGSDLKLRTREVQSW